MTHVTEILDQESGIQYQGVQDKSGEAGTYPIIGLIVGEFKRGRFDKPMIITNENIKAMLGYDPKNPYYLAVQDALAQGVVSVQVVRRKDGTAGGGTDDGSGGGSGDGSGDGSGGGNNGGPAGGDWGTGGGSGGVDDNDINSVTAPSYSPKHVITCAGAKTEIHFQIPLLYEGDKFYLKDENDVILVAGQITGTSGPDKLYSLINTLSQYKSANFYGSNFVSQYQVQVHNISENPLRLKFIVENRRVDLYQYDGYEVNKTALSVLNGTGYEFCLLNYVDEESSSAPGQIYCQRSGGVNLWANGHNGWDTIAYEDEWDTATITYTLNGVKGTRSWKFPRMSKGQDVDYALRNMLAGDGENLKPIGYDQGVRNLFKRGITPGVPVWSHFYYSNGVFYTHPFEIAPPDQQEIISIDTIPITFVLESYTNSIGDNLLKFSNNPGPIKLHSCQLIEWRL